MWRSENIKMVRIWSWAFCLVLILLANGQADERKWFEAYQTGIRWEKEAKYEQARKAFLIAATLRPEPSVRIQTDREKKLQHYDPYVHLANCEIRLGMYVEAAEHLDQSDAAGVTPLVLRTRLRKQLEEATTGGNTRQFSDAKPDQRKMFRPSARSSQKESVLELESSPPGAYIRVDGVVQGNTPLSIHLTPGEHSVEHDLEGFHSGRQNVVVKPGEHVRLLLHLSPEKPATEEPPVMADTGIAAPPAEQQEAPPSEAIPDQENVPSDSGLPQPDARPVETQGEPPNLSSKPGTGTLVLIGILTVIAISSTAFWIKSTSRDRKVTAVAETDRTRALRTQAPSTQLETFVDAAAGRTGTEQVLVSPANSTPTPPPLEELKPLAKPLPLEMPRDFGDYHLQGILGRGGMGTTYLAVRMRDKLPVALKVPHDHLLDHDEFIRRFLREGALGSTLHHPNIIRIYEAGQVKNKPFIAMEALQGETLQNRLKDGNHLPIREALEIARDIALSLDYARLKGIVHRDLKPDNIMILKRGGLKVMDYGIARIMDLPGLTETDYYLGTPAYSAPEAASGDTDQQSDLYSLGIILYRMLCGTLPFPGKTSVEIFHGHLNEPLPDFPHQLNIPASVRNLVEVLTEKQKSDRYAHAEAFLIDLNHVLNQLEV